MPLPLETHEIGDGELGLMALRVRWQPALLQHKTALGTTPSLVDILRHSVGVEHAGGHRRLCGALASALVALLVLWLVLGVSRELASATWSERPQ